MILPKCLVINRPERPDRRDYISRHLSDLGLAFEIVPATNPFTTAGGFMNLATRGAFLSHLQLWERIAREGRMYLILEDDVNIPKQNLDKMSGYLYDARFYGEWHCLYFYSNNWPGLFRVAEGATHGYILNPANAKASSRELRRQYESWVVRGPKNWETHIDQFLSKVMWRRPEFVCIGTEELIFRVDIGSDTGWKENRIEA
jgi:hypothetical protein